MHFLAVVYIILSFLCASAARHTALGFWGGFFFSIVVTPLIGLPFIYFLRWFKNRKKSNSFTFTCPYCKEEPETE